MNEQVVGEMKSLADEIFSITGQKVETTDPIVVASLVQSRLIRQAGLDAKQNIQAAVAASLGEISTAIQGERSGAELMRVAALDLAERAQLLSASTVKLSMLLAACLVAGILIGAGAAITFMR